MTLTSLPPVRLRAWLLIGLLILASAGCTHRDWPSDLLVFTDLTGRWDGTVANRTGSVTRPVSWSLTQSGTRVTGEAATGAAARRLDGKIEGVVNGDVFNFGIGEASATGTLTIDGG